ncbi:hypothetical protein JTE90_007563, partial [Oedothorax gibbosus]
EKPKRKAEAQRIGGFMRVARPKIEVAHEASDETDDSQRYSPLPSANNKEGTHRGTITLRLSIAMLLII